MFSIADAQQGFKCPADRSGQFQHPTQCDKYYECDYGVATEKICPDGLVFDESIRLKNKCDQPFNVDCGDRTELREYHLYLSSYERKKKLVNNRIFFFRCLNSRTTKGYK